MPSARELILSPERMEITFLGTASGKPSARRNSSGIVLRAGGETLLLDCGAPAGQHFLARKIDPSHPRAVWISHAHADHTGQFPPFIQSLRQRKRKAPLRVRGPELLLKTLRQTLEAALLFPERMGFRIDWRPVAPGKRVQEGPFRLRPFATEHLAKLKGKFSAAYPDACFDCYGAVIEQGGRRVVYSADLFSAADLRPALASPVDALICEISHFSPEELFKELEDRPVRSVWLVHYPDSLAGKEASIRKAARHCNFRGAVHLVRDGRTARL